MTTRDQGLQWRVGNLSPAGRRRRKRLLMATLATCLAGAFIGGAIHTVFLASGRVEQMRAHSTYDANNIHEVAKHIQAAGEFVDARTRGKTSMYNVAAAEALLRDDLWQKLAQEVHVPAGDFTMGTDRPMSDVQDQPSHHVQTPAYRIDKYPVTNAQYALFVAETGHKAPGHWKGGSIPKGFELHPVVMVSWRDAQDYCTWAGKHLPTEAEWEKAARGTDGRRWPWGNRMDPRLVNTYNNNGRTTSVFAHPGGASPYGVMDMAGNVAEWVQDDFMPYPGSHAPPSMFIPKHTGTYGAPEHYKPLRGGSWKSDPFSTSTYHRNYTLAEDEADFIGFRCAIEDGRHTSGGKKHARNP